MTRSTIIIGGKRDRKYWIFVEVRFSIFWIKIRWNICNRYFFCRLLQCVLSEVTSASDRICEWAIELWFGMGYCNSFVHQNDYWVFEQSFACFHFCFFFCNIIILSEKKVDFLTETAICYHCFFCQPSTKTLPYLNLQCFFEIALIHKSPLRRITCVPQPYCSLAKTEYFFST